MIRMHTSVRGLGFTTAALFLIGTAAGAQDKPAVGGSTGTPPAASGADIMDKRVSLDIEAGRLEDAIQTIMKSAGAEYTIDSTLRAGTVTLHLSNIKLKVALETLMKVSSLPVTYKLEKGIYHFMPRVEETPPEQNNVDGYRDLPPPPVDDRVIIIIPLRYVDAGQLVRALDGSSGDDPGQSYGILNSGFGGGSVGGFSSISGFGLGGPQGWFTYGGGSNDLGSSGNGSGGSSSHSQSGFGFGGSLPFPGGGVHFGR